MSKTAPAPEVTLEPIVTAPDDLASYQPLKPESEDIPEIDDQWDGRSTKVVLAHPVVRDHQAIGPNSPCIDCGKPVKNGGKNLRDTSHQFHIRTSRDKTGAWVGPEAVHFQDLIALGQIANTQEERDRRQRQGLIDAVRGTYGSKERPEGFPEYKALTLDRLKMIWKHALSGGPQAVIAREHTERRESIAELVASGMGGAASEIARAIHDAFSSKEAQEALTSGAVSAAKE